MPTLVKPENKDEVSLREKEKFMRLALLEGRRGIGLTSPNPPVGAVIVDPQGKVIGKGFHRKAGGPHAEIHAINDAVAQFGADAVRGSDLYVTLEPCSTQGRTSACCDAIIEAGIRSVYMGAIDPNPRNSGAAASILNQAGIAAVSGILEDDANYLIRFFKCRIETGRPWVIAKTAMTLDGHTTLPPERGQWISSEQSREDVQLLRRQVDAIMVGGETVRADDPRLTLRGKHAEGRDQPERVVWTATKDLPQDAVIFNDEFSNQTQVYHGVSLDRVLDDLGKREIGSVLIESGGNLFSHAICRKLIDEVVFYIAPIVGGGENTLMPISGVVADLEEVSVDCVGPDIRVTGRIAK